MGTHAVHDMSRPCPGGRPGCGAYAERARGFTAVELDGRRTNQIHLFAMSSCRLAVILALSTTLTAFAQEPTAKLPGIGAAMQEMIAKNEIAGAVTVVVTKDKVLHLESTGFADVAAKRPMTPDTLFWIASMTKPVTGAAILMLQDEGKLNVADPVAKYLPEFANLKTPSGKPANLTHHANPHAHLRPRRGGRPGRAAGQDARRSGPALARRADAIRARRKVEIHAERHQRRRAHRRGGERHDASTRSSRSGSSIRWG